MDVDVDLASIENLLGTEDENLEKISLVSSYKPSEEP